MYCKECGKQIDDNSKYCSSCGTLQSIKIIDNERNISNNLTDARIANSNNTGSAKRQKIVINEISRFDSDYRKPLELTVLGILLIISIIALSLLDLNIEGYAVVSVTLFVIKIVLVIIIVNTAKEQDRNTTGWGIFGFFFTGLALIIIGLLPKLK